MIQAPIMFRKKQYSPEPPSSPSLQSLPDFFKSPVLPRMNSPFPPLRPDKKYRGVYERAGFEVYKGDPRANHNNNNNNNDSQQRIHSHSANNSSDPSPTLNNFPERSRNFSAPVQRPFNGNNNSNDGSAYRSEPDLVHSRKRDSHHSKASSGGKSSITTAPRIPNNNHHLQESRSMSNPSLYTTRQQPVPQQPYQQHAKNAASSSASSTTNFNYASAYSTPVVDSATQKDENIHLNNFNAIPSNDDNNNTDQNTAAVRNLNIQSQEPYYRDGENQNQYDDRRQTQDSYYPEPNSQDSFSFGRESVMKYEETGNYNNIPRLSELIEEEIGASAVAAAASPDLTEMPTEDDEEQFHDAVPTFHQNGQDQLEQDFFAPVDTPPQQHQQQQQQISAAPPQIVVEEDYDYRQNNEESDYETHRQELDNNDVQYQHQQNASQESSYVDKSDDENDRDLGSDDDGVEVGGLDTYEPENKRPTQSTYMSRDEAYELLTGGDFPARTPDLRGNLYSTTDHPQEEEEEEGEEDAEYTDPTSTTGTNSYNKVHPDHDISSLTNDFNEAKLNKAIDDRFVHQKMIQSPALNLDSATAPLSVSKKSHTPGNSTSGLGIQHEEEQQEQEQQAQQQKRQSEIRHDPGSGPCRKCGLEINEKSIWSKDGQLSGQWHRKCFGCQQCSIPFTKGTNCYVIQDSPYCEQHFHELNNSVCHRCGVGIEGLCLENEQKEKFHPHCLACFKCGNYIDRDYFIVDGVPFCEDDGLAEIERERQLYVNGDNLSRIEKRRTRLLQI